MFLTRKYYSNQTEIVRIYRGLLCIGIKEAVTSRQMHFIILFTSLQKNMYTSNWLSNFSTNNMSLQS